MIDHRFATRGKDQGQLYIPKCKTTQGQFSISYIGVKLWNRIPKDIREMKTRVAFRKLLMKYLMELSVSTGNC